MFLGSFAAASAGEPGHGPMIIPNTQLEPLAWSEIEGWADDDHAAAFATFMKSCTPILKGTPAMRAARPVYGALYEACRRAVAAKPKNSGEARAFFESSFRPVRIAPLGETDGFVTGYYEPVVEGARVAGNGYDVPLYRKPANLLKGGRMLKAASFGHGKGKKKTGRKLVPYHDRAAIEEGVLTGKRLEICYLKDPVDEFFSHIQGSVRVRLADGKMLRLNYDAHNGHPYIAVGKFLIERKIVPREEMSMDRIRQWMTANPDEGKELRRLNKSFVFFRETGLADNEEAIGAQGISLTPWRSIAVDRKLHVYGTPFFISGNLPIADDTSTTPFRRLMIAQDTGGAIIGPARADLYFGAGDNAGVISGRMKNPAKFVMLFPNEIDPVAAGADMPLPKVRPVIAAVEKKADPKAGKAVDPKNVSEKTSKKTSKKTPQPKAAKPTP